jgi:hypothetical protein
MSVPWHWNTLVAVNIPARARRQAEETTLAPDTDPSQPEEAATEQPPTDGGDGETLTVGSIFPL